jgi:hypothetical protein
MSGTNSKVDDQDGRILYFGNWKSSIVCTDCSVIPDRTQVQSGTWHEGLFDANSEYTPSVQLTFAGSLPSTQVRAV